MVVGREPSTARVVVDVPGLIIVEVAHGIATSFSRSVLPTANRAWRKAENYGAATMCRVALLAPDFADRDGGCTSWVAYGPTRDSAQAGLDAHVEVMVKGPVPVA